MLTHIRAITSEFMGKLGIDLAFKKKENLALIFAYTSKILFSGSRRGSLLLSYLYIRHNKMDKAVKIFNTYEKRAPLLINLAKAIERYKTKNKYLIPRVYSLTQTWNKTLPVPRQIQSHSDQELISQSFNINSYEFKSNKEILHIIAEDHEWSITPGKSEGKKYLTLREARIQLVEKGRIVNKICQDAGVPWSHLIDFGSYLMIYRAALLFPNSWGELLEELHLFFIETIKTGNDLGIHVHYDKSFLAAEKIEEDRIFINNEHLKTWGDLEEFGTIEDPISKFGMVAGCKNLLEKYGRKVDPEFSANFFRSGSYSMGTTIEQTRISIEVLLKAGILVSSSALSIDGITESIGRLSKECVYNAKFSSPWEKEKNYSNELFIEALPLRTKYLARYCVMDMARLYHRKPHVLEDVIQEAQKGQRYIISVDHDIDIGFSKYGGSWDSLDEDSGDFKILKKYIIALSKQKDLKCIKANDFVKHIMEQIYSSNGDRNQFENQRLIG